MSSFANDNQHNEVPSPVEIELMADVLRARLGAEAGHVAMFFANEQKALGDAERYEAWAAVAEQIKKMEDAREEHSATLQ